MFVIFGELAKWARYATAQRTGQQTVATLCRGQR
jgi:hypothetical protein